MDRIPNILRNRKYWLVGLFLLLVVLATLYVFNASIPGRAPEGCPRGARRLPGGAGPLRVVDLNMLHGFPDFKDLPLRIDLIAGEIRRLDADVVLLQEVPWTAPLVMAPNSWRSSWAITTCITGRRATAA